MARNKQLPIEYYDFGRFIEKKVFGAAVDWVESESDVADEYLQQIINSVKNKTFVPKIENLREIVERDDIVLMGFDHKKAKTFF